MAKNRFYRPSSPRYTSQFVEEQYPEDLILQAGAMKYAQKQQATQNISELSALNNLLQPGYRTQEIAPGVQKDYNDKLNSFISKHTNDYDSPQALMELQQLRYSWLADPRVQLVKQDREVGNAEYEKMRINSKNYQMDYDPNIHPQTGNVVQFRENERYRPYAPLTAFQDVDKQALEMLYKVNPDEREGEKIDYRLNPVTGEREEVKIRQRYKYRDMNKMQPVIESLVSGTLNGTIEGAAYLKTKFRDANGNLREPKVEELRSYFTNLAEQAKLSEISGGIDTKNIEPSEASQKRLDAGKPVTGTGEWAETPFNYNKFSKKDVNLGFIDRLFKRPDEAENNPHYTNIKRKLVSKFPEFNNWSKSEQDKKFKEYLDDTHKEPYGLNWKSRGTEAEKELNTLIAGATNADGYLDKAVTSEWIRGATIIDYQTGKIVQNMDDKDALTAKGNTFRVHGRMADDSLGKQPMPGSVMIEAGKAGEAKQYLFIAKDAYDEERDMWNFYGFERAKDSGVGDVFAIDFGRSGAKYSDISDSGSNWDDTNITAKSNNGLYFVPVQTANEDIEVRVFSENPNTKKVNSLDDNNLYLLKVYKASDYYSGREIPKNAVNEIDAMRLDIYKDANDLLELKKKK